MQHSGLLKMSFSVIWRSLILELNQARLRHLLSQGTHIPSTLNMFHIPNSWGAIGSTLTESLNIQCIRNSLLMLKVEGPRGDGKACGGLISNGLKWFMAILPHKTKHCLLCEWQSRGIQLQNVCPVLEKYNWCTIVMELHLIDNLYYVGESSHQRQKVW